MSKYTTLETSKKLYEVFPEWNDTYCEIRSASDLRLRPLPHEECVYVYRYDIGYLLDKLPRVIGGDWLNIFANTTYWCALYGRTTTAQRTGLFGEADTLAEALALLALELKDKEVL